MSQVQADHARALRIARETLNHPAHLAIVQSVVEALNSDPRHRLDILGSHLAYAYARGIINGWRARENQRGDEIPFLPPEATP